jgi:hypothetical protein
LTDEVRVVVVLAWLTTWDTAALVLVRKLPSPTYVAVIEWVPAAKPLVEKVAVNGAVADRAPVPITVVPSRKFTVPVGVPAPGAVTVTVAVNVTLCPNVDGFREEARVVIVLALLTTWLTGELVLVRKLPSPT